jgi:hypothetical protein
MDKLAVLRETIAAMHVIAAEADRLYKDYADGERTHGFRDARLLGAMADVRTSCERLAALAEEREDDLGRMVKEES